LNASLGFPGSLQYLNTREILLLVGARRTGKSTLLYQVIHSLLEKGIQDTAILFINLDEPLFRSMSDDPGTPERNCRRTPCETPGP
jgi:predicted AAA+ superfamily ATPase